MANGHKPKFHDICSAVVAMICIAVPFVLLGVALSWTIQQPSVSYVNFGREYVATEGQSLQIAAPMAIYTSNSTMYRLRIHTREGNVVYEYEDLQAGGTLRNFESPSSLPAGQYWIGGTVSYRLNPLKNVEVILSIGSLEVKRKSE